MFHSEDNITVNGLWIGDTLSAIELLTLASFINNGHKFRLWVYRELKTVIPTGVELMYAGDIIPEERIFRYRNTDQFGHGKGSLGGFSDIFRYKLLYEHGGWWSDMDVTCLKPLDFDTPYAFRPHHDIPVDGNIIKCPAGSTLMRYCYERALSEVDENNRDWHLPILILNEGLAKFGLSEYIYDFANQESWFENLKMIVSTPPITDNWRVIHWINEEWRRSGIDKNFSAKSSLLRNLLQINNVDTGHLSKRRQYASLFKAYFPVKPALNFRQSLSAIKRILFDSIGN